MPLLVCLVDYFLGGGWASSGGMDLLVVLLLMVTAAGGPGPDPVMLRGCRMVEW